MEQVVLREAAPLQPVVPRLDLQLQTVHRWQEPRAPSQVEGGHPRCKTAE